MNHYAAQATPYPLSLLQAAWRGLAPKQSLIVTAVLPSGEAITGAVLGIGSRLGIRTDAGVLIENVRPEWIARCDTRVSN